jgi:uncharacterized protein YndB with AHSA1/START domain
VTSTLNNLRTTTIPAEAYPTAMPLTVWIRFSVGTTEREDRVQVRFVELLPGRRIVEAATFETDDPALKGEMTIAVTFEPTAGGTRVTFEATNLPPGVRAEDHKTGTKISLGQLAQLFAQSSS